MISQGAGNGERYPPRRGRGRLAGFTLLEVIVVVAILGLIFGVSALAFVSLRAPRESAWVGALRQARATAIMSGRPTRAEPPPETVRYRSLLPAPLFLPDGRAIGDGADPLSGAPNAR
jgi:prepilin-type N-terminal cleavage/methylation domain-containing protein